MKWMNQDFLVEQFEALDRESMVDEETTIEAWVDLWCTFFGASYVNQLSDLPTVIEVSGSGLKIGVDSVTGSADATGTPVRVEYKPTEAFDTSVVVFDSANYIEVGMLGQSGTPSFIPADYALYIAPWNYVNEGHAKNAMREAMSGFLDEGVLKLYNGINAWWGFIQDTPSNFYQNGTAIELPPNLLNLVADLDTIFIQNTEADPPLTANEAMAAVAEVIVEANTGGVLSVGLLEYDIE